MKKLFILLFLFLFLSFLYATDNCSGTTLDFDGNSSGDYVQVPYSYSLNSYRFTVSFWAKVDGEQGSSRSPITSRSSTKGFMFYASNDDHWEFWTRNGTTTSNKIEGPNVELYKWVYVVGTYNGSVMKLYINGELADSLVASYIPNSTYPLRIGAGNTQGSANYFFKGKIDELSIWNRAKDITEIREDMHNTLSGTEIGLVSYWQFNEGSGNTLHDYTGNHNGTLTDMESQDWVSSSAPVGNGTSDTHIVNTTGHVNFTGTYFSMDFTSKTGVDTFTVSKILCEPNSSPNDVDGTINSRYWVVNKFGNGTFVADLSFTTSELISDNNIYKLYRRDATSNGEWTFIKNATNTSEHTVEFDNINTDEGTGQLLICYVKKAIIATIDDFKKFNYVTYNFGGINVGYFSAPAISDLDGDGLLDLLIGERDGNINHYEQDAENSTSFSLVTNNFNGIDVGYFSAPAITDLDGDGLLDMLIGEQDGNINHYEQDSENSTSFSLVTDNFNGIDVGQYSAPTFTDLDGDGLLDLLIGEYYGNINHYEQDAENSTSFSFVTNNFNGIDVGSYSAPTFTDLDGDGLLDMLIGEYYGNINHYEQSGCNSLSFGTILTGNTSTQSYYVRATNLSANLDISCIGIFQISLSQNSGFSQSLSIAPTNGNIADSIFVRFQPSAEQEYSGIITHTTTNADTKEVTLSGTGKDVENYPGTALDFDGSNDYVKIADDNSLDLTTDYTIEAWIKPKSFSSMAGIVSKYHSNSANGYFLRLTDSSPYTGLTFDEMSTTNGILEADKWYHIAAVNDNGTRHLYVNGKEQTLSGTPLSIQANTDFLTIGVDYLNSGRYFDGQIEEVRIWNVALSSLQIREKMNLPLTRSETGLVSYYQFNEGSGSDLIDMISRHDGMLHNMSDDDWVTSSIPFGGGYSDTETENSGTITFTNTGLSMNFNAQNGASITVTRIDTTANENPKNVDSVFDNQYWVVSRYGTGNFDADLTFSVDEDISSELESTPDKLRLYKRTFASDSDWSFVETANTVNATNNTVTFSGITEFGQFIICQSSRVNISVNSDTLNFGTIEPGDSLPLNLTISNTGLDTLIISSISATHSFFSSDTQSCIIAPNDSINVTVTFAPLRDVELNEYMLINSNDPNYPEKRISLVGKAIERRIVLLDNNKPFTLVTDNFNAIDVGQHSAPTTTDLDGDGLLDMLIGEENGNIYHYEQDTINSTSFSLVTDNFNEIDVGSYSAPTFTDLNGDRLLDLLIGEQNGNINYYEQDAINSTSFSLVTDNFNGIDVGSYSAPTFTDLDGDGLLDLLIGEQNGNIDYYEQEALNSTSFTLVTDNFNGINVGSYSAPTFTDLDDDGLLDLLIGEYNGNIYHYEQDTINSTSFTLVKDKFNTIDIGILSKPTIIDMDGDGLLDMLIGESNGNINHYEQNVCDSLTYEHLLIGNTSTKSYLVKATNISANLNISCTGNFQISLSENSGFSQSLSITPTDGTISDTVYVRFLPTLEQEYTGTVTHTATGANTKEIALSGYGVDSSGNYPGTALDFDGADDYVKIEDDNSLDLTTDYTIEAWIKPKSFSSMAGIVSKYQSNGANGYYLRLTNSSPYTGLTFDDMSTANGILEADKWYHIAAVNDNGTRHFYVNGKEQTLSGIPLSVQANADFLTIGVDFLSSGRNFDGQIEEVRIWDTALDSLQIRENMNLSLMGTESGLVSYYQFNEDDGNILNDIVSGNYGTLYNMTNDNWVTSTIPFGGGYSDTETETSGTVDFTNTGLSMTFNSQTGASITVIRIDTTANVNPTQPEETLDNQYWVVNRNGTGNFDADITFTVNENISSELETTPRKLLLYRRTLTSDENWSLVKSANSASAANNTVTFNGITEFGQFIICRDSMPIISISSDSLNFGTIETGDSLSVTLTISNTGMDTLDISSIYVTHSFFSANVDSCIVAPNDSINVMVTFAPLRDVELNEYMLINSNDPNYPEKRISLIGNAVHKVLLLNNSDTFTLKENNLGGIDIGYHSVPVLTDLDGDGLLDMLIGELDGNIRHYEQTAINSTSFTFVSSNFNGIDVGDYSAPTFTDLDGDGLLDMLIGELDGNINHYEQVSKNSTSFSLVTDNFNGIDVGQNSAPTFTDLDGDGLLDLLIGEYGGNINHYEQTSENSTSFTLVTNNFNGIYVGSSSAPTFTDLDGNGLLDMLIGETNGNINHYEQDFENSTSFTLVTDNFNKIDVGSYSAPTIINLDGDGLLDMLIGETNGNINHYEQNACETLAFGYVYFNSTSTKKYYIKATHLTANLDIGCTENYQISLSENSGYSQSLSITPANGSISDTVFVRFQPTLEQEYTGIITHTTAGVDTKEITVTGYGKDFDTYPGTALNFDGSNDYVKIADDNSLDLTNNYTIEVWIKPESFNSMAGIVSKYQSNGANGYFLRLTGSSPYTGLTFDEISTANGILEADKWYHIAAVNDNGTRHLYVNGKEQTLSGAPLSVQSNADPLRIGSDFSSRYFNGKIDEVRIWNVALDSLHIRENMNLSLDNGTGLVSYWQFNEGGGNTLNDIVSDNYGTLYNMTNDYWVVSTIPFGSGYSDTESETNGTISFTNTGLSMNFNSQTGASITVTRIDTTANVNPTEPDEVFDKQYWVVNRFGNGSFNTDLTLTINEDLTASDENNPSQIALFTRASTADTSWVYLTDATSVDATNNKATFRGITEFSQFIVTRWQQSIDAPQNVAIEISGGNVQLLWDEVAGANSYKIFACDTPNGTFTDVTSQGTFGSNSKLSVNYHAVGKLKETRSQISSLKRKSIKIVNAHQKHNRATVTWTAPITEDKKFYYVVASTESGRMLLRNVKKR